MSMRIEKYKYREDFGKVPPGMSMQEAQTLQEKEILKDALREAYESGLEDGRQEGMAKGRQEAEARLLKEMERKIAEATKNAVAAHDAQMKQVLAQLAPKLDALQKSWLAEGPQRVRRVLELALAIAGKIHGKILSSAPFEGIGEFLAGALRPLQDMPALTVMVHPDLLASAEKEGPRILQAIGYRGDVRWAASPQLKPGDCQLHWKDGFAEYSADQLMHSLEETIARYMQPHQPKE